MGCRHQGRPLVPVVVRRRFWRAVRAGCGIAGVAGVSGSLGERWFSEAGGVIPSMVREPVGRLLCFAEREEIAVLRAAGCGVREVARRIGRDPGTVSRELRRIVPSGRHRDRQGYRASLVEADADEQASRPQEGKLAGNLRLRREVQDRLRPNHCAEQISARLREDFREDPQMRVSYEAIYRSLYVQGKGELKRELVRHLRTGRSMRKPRREPGQRRGRIPGMINISERPAEVADRAVPGDWEYDLILGSTASGSAIGTLVERVTGFVMLLHLPGNHGAQARAGRHDRQDGRTTSPAAPDPGLGPRPRDGQPRPDRRSNRPSHLPPRPTRDVTQSPCNTLIRASLPIVRRQQHARDYPSGRKGLEATYSQSFNAQSISFNWG